MADPNFPSHNAYYPPPAPGPTAYHTGGPVPGEVPTAPLAGYQAAYSPAGYNAGQTTFTAGYGDAPQASPYSHSGTFHGVAVPTGVGAGGPPQYAPTGASAHSFEVVTPEVVGGRKDTWAAVLFWIHILVLFILAMALGIPAVKNAEKAGDDASRGSLDFSASLFIRMIVLSCSIGGIVSALFFFVLQRFGGAMIRIALWTSVVVQVVMAATMFAYAPVGGVFLLLLAAMTACYIYFVRNRIAFAAAHLQCACDALRQYPSVFGVAVLMLVVQALLVSIWSLAAFGVASKLNGDSANTGKSGASGSGGSSEGSGSGGIIVFVFLISFYWGAQVFTNIVHFVTASVVGHWWFAPTPSNVVRGSLHRAFTESFGSIALGSLIVAVLRALYVMAKNSEERAQRRGDRSGAFLAGCAACLLRLVGDAVEYFNKWAYVYVALTGQNFRAAGKSAWDLFKSRGFSAIINDDLTGTALGLACVMVGAVSAVIGAAAGYVAMGSAHNGTYAGVIGFFCFITGFAMATVMAGVLKSGVRTIFVCFAMNPIALQQTHPSALQGLVAAWNQFHPQVFTSCGYATAFGGVPMGLPSQSV